MIQVQNLNQALLPATPVLSGGGPPPVCLVSWSPDTAVATWIDGAGNHVGDLAQFCASADFGSVTSLDLNFTGITDISGLTSLPVLATLDVGNNNLTTLTLDGLTALTTCAYDGNPITDLSAVGCVSWDAAPVAAGACGATMANIDLTGCTGIVGFFDITSAPYAVLQTLTMADCTSLVSLFTQSIVFTSLDVSGCSGLMNLAAGFSGLTSINVTGCIALDVFDCSNNLLASTVPVSIIGFGAISTLHVLDCSANLLDGTLDVTPNTLLVNCNCSGNLLDTLVVINCANMQSLDAYNNQLLALPLTGCSSLNSLACGNNLIASLDCSPCLVLQSLFTDNNPLTLLNIGPSTQYAIVDANTCALLVNSVNTCLDTLMNNCLPNAGTVDLSLGTSATPDAGPPNGAFAAGVLSGAGWSVTTN